MVSKFQAAEAERKGVEVNLDFLEDQLFKHSTTPLDEIMVDQHINLVDDCKQKLSELHTTLMTNAPTGTDLGPYSTAHKGLLGRAFAIYSSLRGLKLNFPVVSPPPHPRASTSTSTSSVPDIKLPRLELPTFNGNIQEWVAFRDMFESSIGCKSISKTHKLTYLKSCLSGEAARQVRSLIISEDNYDIAWKCLTDRYANERELLFAVLRRFISQPNVNSNAVSLRTMVDTSKECIRSLEVLRLPVTHWSAILLFILFNKLDQQSKELWEQSLKDTSIPSIDDLFNFLEQRARALAAGSSTTRAPAQVSKESSFNNRRSAHNLHLQHEVKCKLLYSNNHPLYKCTKFLALKPNEKLDFVTKQNLCRNCLSSGHFSSRCESKHSCKTCKKKHHSLLHYDSPPPVASADQTNGNVASHHIQDTELHTALLATAIVKILDHHGQPHLVRALLDGGSSVSFLTDSFARKINLSVTDISTQVTGLQASSVGTSRGSVSIVLKPRFDSSVSYTTTVLLIPKITTKQPTSRCDRSAWPHLKNLSFADPHFDTPSNVDLLLGADVFWNLILPNKIEGSPNSPVAINSQFGWLVAGPQQPTARQVTTFVTDVNLDNQLRRFWEIETVSEHPAMSTEEKSCENHFALTHNRDGNGRFTVNIPWKTPQPPLGSSREHAISRLQQLEKRLTPHQGIKDPKKREEKLHQRAEYNKFMKQYEDMGHMSVIPEAEIIQPKNPTAYIPHHFIQKESSSTTKFRVVFDASAKTSSNHSVNDMMMVGPTIQDSLHELIVRFRTHNIAYTADIEKMYRQIAIAPADRDMQRIVWRESPNHPIKDYRLNTVTYGTASAPYLATKCLQQLADDEKLKFPLGSQAAKKDLYVDDLMSGTKTTSTAISTVREINNLCSSAGFPLRKWTCNDEEVLASLPDDVKETKTLIPIDDDEQSVKTLGIFWNPREDNYHFKINLPPDMPGSYTKRTVLSEMSKIFDPLGWLAPVIIQAKIFMQKLWMEHHDWDTALPATIQQQWSTFKSDLILLEKIKIPRCVLPNNPIQIRLCGFSDASESAYSAVLYTVCYYDDHPPLSRLITSKTRVAPVKAATLPRLELCGAVLLSHLIKTTTKAMNIEFNDIHCYTDSTIVLAWVSSSPLRWKTYVRNRVQEILDNAPSAKWFHVKGESNPADCASRGITPHELMDHPLWWNGNLEMHHISPDDSAPHDDVLRAVKTEEKPVTVHHITLNKLTNPSQSILERFSTFNKLQRVRAWMQRFVNNCRKSSSNRQLGRLTTSELQAALLSLVKNIQQHEFSAELKLLSEGKYLPTNNKLLSLSPFIDKEGILRVGGRLKNAPISMSQKHPMLLPKNNYIIKLIILDIHQRYFHAGPQLVLSIINQRFWIIRGKDTVRYQINKCVTCTRHKGETMTQFMGELPAARVTPNPPFSVCGVDYAGPFSTKPPTRSNIILKSWLAIFVCFVTKAIHLEVVSSLSTEHFIAALRRFISRRGLPSAIHSDCGTNFVGAKRVVNHSFSLCSSKAHNDKVTDECASMGIQWHMNPPGGPHFGGLWEAGVKSIKHHLYRVTGSALLTFEEMETLVIQIEALLNSRPIIPSSTDPADLSALTPAHFLIGRPFTSIPDPELAEENIGRLKRWQLIQQQQQLFWKRWSSEFISRMQQRPKWMNHSTQLQINDMVIIKDERLPPLKWKLGRVLKVHPGADNHVRVATVKTAEGELLRPIRKLCHLPIETKPVIVPPQNLCCNILQGGGECLEPSISF